MVASDTTVPGGKLLSANSQNLPRAGVVLQGPVVYRAGYRVRWPVQGLTIPGRYRCRGWAGDALK